MSTSTGKRIADVAEEGAAKLEHLSVGARQAAERAQREAASALRESSARTQEFGRQLSQRRQFWTEEMRDCVRDHPLASVAIAVGVGMLLNRLLSR